MNRSPWLAELSMRSAFQSAEDTLKTDVIVIGGGIAGFATAYHILENTKLNVVLIEKDRIAHGATGHNAGQVTSYFEKSLTAIAQEYGEDLALQGQRDVLSGWGLLESMLTKIGEKELLKKFLGSAGCHTIDQIIGHLERKKLRSSGGVQLDTIEVNEKTAHQLKSYKQYDGLYTTVSQKKIMETLQTSDTSFAGALYAEKGVMNSALLCEKTAIYLTERYSTSFHIFENSPIQKIILENQKGICLSGKTQLEAKNIILCTNGYQTYTIENNGKKDIHNFLKTSIEGVISTMAAYLDNPYQKPAAISYFLKGHELQNTTSLEPYFYLTRRAYNFEGKKQSLISIGGQDRPLPHGIKFNPSESYNAYDHRKNDTFLHQIYAQAPHGKINYPFKRYGLMGHTPTKLRMIGPDPRNGVLHYNLGCNGIGILPGIFGGRKISQFLLGKVKEKSIFDVG